MGIPPRRIGINTFQIPAAGRRAVPIGGGYGIKPFNSPWQNFIKEIAGAPDKLSSGHPSRRHHLYLIVAAPEGQTGAMAQPFYLIIYLTENII